MILVELIAVIASVAGLGFGAHLLDEWKRKALNNSLRAEKTQKQMQDDLREALRSRDHRRLDDWLVIYADHVTPETKKHVLARRDELYIDKP